MTTSSISPKQLSSLLPSLNGHKVLLIGDVMLDRYIFGTVERISPEAPVPVVHVEKERNLLGGAGNVARNLLALGGSPLLIGICGCDTEADILHQVLRKDHINAILIEDKQRTTTVKTRVIAHSQQVVRIDHETTAALAEEHTARILDAVAKHLQDVSVIIVSDYNKGIISEQLITQLKSLVRQANPNIKLLADTKPHHFGYFTDFYLITPNAKEAAQGCGLDALDSGAKVYQAGNTLLEKLTCDNLLITLGAHGMALFQQDHEVHHIQAMAQNTFDVTGAGDTVIATLGLALAAGHSLLVSSILANYAAGIVVGEVGAATTTQQDLGTALEKWTFPPITQWNGVDHVL